MTDYEKLTVVKLREELNKRGLPKAGVKAILVNRLLEADGQSAHAEIAPSRTKADGIEGGEVDEVTVTPIAALDGQETESPVIVGNGLDTKGNFARPLDNLIDDPSAAKKDTNQEVPPGPGATSIEAREPVENVFSQTTQAGAAGVPPTKEQPAKAASTPTQDDDATLVEKQVATPTTQLAVESTDPVAPSAEEQTRAVSRSESATGEEMIKDIRKRKRRSLTPTPSDESIQKKAKTANIGSNVKLPEDEPVDDAHATPMTDAPIVASAEAQEPNGFGDTTMENAPPIVEVETSGEADQPFDLNETKPLTNDPGIDVDILPDALDTTTKPKTPEAEAPKAINGPPNAPPESPAKTSSPSARFKNLLPASSRQESSPPRPAATEDTNDRIVSPALHPATTALYIRDILRPLHVDNLKEHLVALATPSDSSPNSAVIADFFLDSIRTHCLVRFATVAAASRVRTGLHDRVWPDEKNRKPLWVDFVPEEKLLQWFEVENASSGRGQTAKRYEVVYENEDDGVKAYLQLVGSNNNGWARGPQATGSKKESGAGVQGAPLGPRIREGEKGGSHMNKPHPDQGRGFQALDDLFKSTTAKPKLYYLPVPQRTAEKRLDLLAEGRGGGRREGMHRYTFDDGVLVDRGPETQRGRGFIDRGRGGSYRGYSDRRGGYRGDYRGDYEYRGAGGDYRSEYRDNRR
ncbi:MAG: hypothetical protein Q9172_004405 [Xanthocarpia lactea]